MRQMIAGLALIAAYAVLVGGRFAPGDGDRLSAAGRVVAGRVRDALPPAARLAGPAGVLRGELPERVEDRVRARLTGDKRLAGVTFVVTADGGAVTLRGVVPDPTARRRAVAVAENTVGVETVTDELAVPAE